MEAYLATGGALEPTARNLFVHPNTVRYRLHRIADLTGRDPWNPRDLLVLQTAVILGRLATNRTIRMASFGGLPTSLVSLGVRDFLQNFPQDLVPTDTSDHPRSCLANGVLAIVAPGQGSQKPGMLSSWLELDGVRRPPPPCRTGPTSTSSGSAPPQTPTRSRTPRSPSRWWSPPPCWPPQHLTIPDGAVIAGHSVGELAAAALAGVLPALDAVDLAAVRGTAMSAACALTPTGMSALMGGDTDTVLATLAELDLVGANVNGGGQIVAAGPLDALAQLAANPPAGVRVIPLPVAGAFHTSFMGSAESAFAGPPGRDRPRPIRSTRC